MKRKKQSLVTIDTPVYSYWQAIFLSFFSAKLYVDISKRWKGFGLCYLLLIIAIATIPLSIRLMLNFNDFFVERLILPVESLPPLYIQEGKVIVDKTMPHLVRNTAGEAIAVIDTNAAAKELAGQYPRASIFITSSKFYFRVPDPKFFFQHQIQPKEDALYEQSLSSSDTEVFVGKEWLISNHISYVKWLILSLIYPTIAVYCFTLYLGFLLIFAFLGQLIAKVFFNLKLKFKESARLLAVSSTLQTLLFFILLSLNIFFTGMGLIYTTILLIYFCFAIISVKRQRSILVNV